MTMPKFTDDITCSDCHTPRMEVGRIGEEWVCWSCTKKRVESTRQQLAEALAECAKAAACYGGICRTLEESGKRNTGLMEQLTAAENSQAAAEIAGDALESQLLAVMLERDALASELQVQAKDSRDLRQRLAEARAAMEAAGSLPGKDWLIGQLALAEYLDGKGGPHLKYAIEQYEEYKRAAEAGGVE